MKAGFDVDLVRRQYPRTDEIPFDAEHRFMATLHHTHDDGTFILVKGAPERLISICSCQLAEWGDAPIDTHRWYGEVESLAARDTGPWHLPVFRPSRASRVSHSPMSRAVRGPSALSASSIHRVMRNRRDPRMPVRRHQGDHDHRRRRARSPASSASPTSRRS
jgi:hypothetical protein